MSKIQALRASLKEIQIQNAISALKNKFSLNIAAAARRFQVPRTTLWRRMGGDKSRAEAHESEQIVSNAEERSLVGWITRLGIAGFPQSPALVVEMAYELRASRVQAGKTRRKKSASRAGIGHNWLQGFKARNAELAGIWTRQIEASRYSAANFDDVKLWFDAVAQIFLEYGYDLSNVYNMDESGFAMGESQ